MIQWKNSAQRWGVIAQVFHWTIVVLIITQFVLANMAENLPLGMAKLATLARHKSVGITIFGLALLRLGWRLSNPVSPPLPADYKGVRRGLAHLSHYGLYALIFAMPLTGWLMSSAKNYPVSWFGFVTLPDLVQPDDGFFELMRSTHGVLAGTLLALAVLHVLAALYHHFMRKDDILKRMLPFTLLAGSALLLGTASSQTRSAEPAKPAAAAAAIWTADPAKSTLEFVFVQAGAKTTGKFARFTADVDFSPASPATGRIDVSIDMGSHDTRDKERDDTLRMADLFNTAKYPRSTYVASQFTAKGATFEGTGKLTLRGVSLNVPITFTFTPGTEAGKPAATLKGTATVKRLLFGVGQGEWKSTEWISDEVQVQFNLLLQPRATRPAVPPTPAPAQSR